MRRHHQEIEHLDRGRFLLAMTSLTGDYGEVILGQPKSLELILASCWEVDGPRGRRK